MTADPVIEVRNLRKSYGDKVAVADVSFTVQRGEIFGVLGPNGAGKTTTVECLAGLRQADAGSARVLGVDTQNEPADIRDDLGIQLQESALPPKLRVREALALYAAFYRDPADSNELLDMLGLGDKADTAFENLSGGQKQRLSIALALIGNPQVAILDELTTGLDPQARRDTWSLIERVRDAGVTILLVTHFMDEAERLCDRLVIIDDGTVAAQGPPGELIRGLEQGRTFRMRLPANASPLPLDLEGLPDVHTVTAVGRELEIAGTTRVLPSVIVALSQHDIIPDEVRTISRSLEDVFVAITGHRTPALEESAS